MCGIAGIIVSEGKQVDIEEIKKMISLLKHRGPDEFGIYLGKQTALSSARLSIIDLTTGTQPMHNEDHTLWIVFNGEIYNYVELRPILEAKGHTFYTKSDTEVILHAYEEYGPECVERFNGQFAFAIWDTRTHQIFLARDRLGVRPLFYNFHKGIFSFASEIKSLFTLPHISRQVDPIALDQIFTMWATLSPRTPFKNIWELPPGCVLTYSERSSSIQVTPYWKINFREDSASHFSIQDYSEQLSYLLRESTRMRLRADVPVGAYLSGGLDSSIITSLIKEITPSQLKTFSIQFSDPSYDESSFQKKMIEHLNVDHQEIFCTHNDIAEAFPEVIWHTESPLLRTAPVPLMLLSQLVRSQGMKVVLTGEGADEMLAGYNIFKEAKVRYFWSKYPASRFRPLLIQKLYPYIERSHSKTRSYLAHFFKQGLEDTHLPYYSHLIRWKNTSRIKRYFSNAIREQVNSYSAIEDFEKTLDDHFHKWDLLHKAQFIEIQIFLSHYLLSSQGDRVSMANSVEGRYPFLDHHFVEFCFSLPPQMKLKGLREKYLLREAFKKCIPPEVLRRDKHPYRAPIFQSFFSKNSPEYVEELFSERKIQEKGYFKEEAIKKLIIKGRNGTPLGEIDNMAIAGILSVQLLDELFIKNFTTRVDNCSPIEVNIYRQ